MSSSIAGSHSHNRASAQASSREAKQGKARKNTDQLQAMLQTPTNNFGLASLFKNFVLIGEQYQLEQVGDPSFPLP